MSLKKKGASSKRTTLPLRSDMSKDFRKDWNRLSDSGRYDLIRLKRAMMLLGMNEGPLPAEYQDHALTDDWKDHRECHVGGDFLLIYRITKDAVIFVRAGTHPELFG